MLGRSLKWKLEALGTIQSLLFSVDSQYNGLLKNIVTVANIPPKNHTFFAGSTLRMCNYLPHNDGSCSDVFTINQPLLAMIIDSDQNVTENNRVWRTGLEGTGFFLKPSNDPNSVDMEGESGNITLSKTCVQTLILPFQDLSNFRRESLAFVFLQFWLFGISVLAMIQDSVPHLLAGIGARILLTAWSAYVIWRTRHLSSVYEALLGDPGTPCSVDFFPTYFSTRSSLEIPDLVLNFSALTIMIWTLLRVYAVQSYKCVGAPAHILRIRKFFMAIQACLQLEVYILPAGMGLWIDQLFNTYIRYISEHTILYEGIFIFHTVMVVPWIVLGWYAVRYERKKWMFSFIFVGFLFLLAESLVFDSQVYRWTFIMWANFACFTVAYMIVIIACVILGIVCLRNFDQGLAQYLHAESALASSNFAPEVFQHREDVDMEKAPLPEFPIPLHVLKGAELDRPPSTYYLPTLHADDTSPGGVVVVKKDRW
ncbi:uncharacterized protein BT62DRAFT_924236 [Guyanagaster necrorhizus]|uniref:Transmembrane protein n=1 Tax=Guyanagaster necrorhizus TaxID=856835 RepID=A0A9P7VFS4_9AGAR|nr:uncharacterized protein BT62DRAFT_924236 [Guyanagaster necrorhizus MCA 3950]KAG7440131.1 hypothetical protein BT62DRAFT_924236 [Guyanagaster necrorhizus MCA 3950]